MTPVKANKWMEENMFPHYPLGDIKVDGELIEVDSRPSDAIAVAVTCDPPLPIYVDEEVLEDAIEP